MIVDSSALVAVVRGEPGGDRFFRTLSDQREPKRMSAANYLEAAIMIDGARSPIASRRFDDAVAAVGIIVEPVTLEQAEIARAAYRDFGKGSGHPAGLNFGDCFAYALARARPRDPAVQGRRLFADGRRDRLAATMAATVLRQRRHESGAGPKAHFNRYTS